MHNNSNVWKDKVTIPIFGRIRSEFQCLQEKSEFQSLEETEQNSNV